VREEIETSSHLFVKCEVTKHLKRKLDSWINDTLEIKFKANVEDFLFGFGNEEVIILDQIYLTAKEHIYTSKQKVVFPSLETFKRKLFIIRDMDKYIAVKTGTQQTYNAKWKPLANL
jgi:hypothetical protein